MDCTSLAVAIAATSPPLPTQSAIDGHSITAPGRMLVWDAARGSLRGDVASPETDFTGGNYSRDSSLQFVSGNEKELKVWSAR